MRRLSFSFIIILTLLISLLTACSQNQDEAANITGKLNVVATTGQIHDAVANIAGDGPT